MRRLISGSLSLVATSKLHAAPGDLDPTFGSGGKIIAVIGFSSEAQAVSPQADGKIIIVGVVNSEAALVRYNPDGSLDTSFDSDGKITISFNGNATDEATGVAVQSDGKIVIVGRAFNNTTGDDFALARFNSDGSLDISFDGDGKVTTNIRAIPSPDRAVTVALQPDGKIIAVGRTFSTSNKFALARYLVEPAACGDDILDDGEQCDDGNTTDGDCCSSSCQFEANTTVCRVSAGVCDIAETCTGSSGTCPGETFESPSTECRAAVGECDLAENCSGASADCPSDSVKTNGTTCTDDGNVCSADICNGSSTECQHPAGNAGTVCRASTGACDVAETCTGDSLSCPADTGAPDSDDDGQCDAVDLCTNGAPVISGKLILANFATGNGDDTLNFSGTLAFTALPALDPIANGARVRVEDADGALFDVTVPGGVYNTVTKTGWKLNTPGTQWKFSSPTAVGGVITQVILTKKTPQLKFIVKGKKGAFAALPVTAPISAALILTPPLGLTGACGDVSFSGAQCAFNAGQKTLTCQR